jgi:ribosomal protein S12 methylthiotransferase accessory factor YcaO
MTSLERKAPGSYDRSVPLAETLARLPGLYARFGITRIADLTLLDRTGLAVLNAVVPDSADLLSTYSGKGLTSDHARVGAVMEAVERQIACAPAVDVVTIAPRDVRAGIDGMELGLPDALWERPLPFARGWDIIRDEPALVPLAAVQCPWRGERIFRWSTTSGIASGNTRTEAVYHALTELVERHRWSVAHARGHLRPKAILEALAGGPWRYARDVIDDAAGSFVTLPTGSEPVDGLLAAIEHGCLIPRLIALAGGPLPPVILATVTEPGSGSPMVHIGLGCSWSPEHAAIRALTEAVQSRVVDIQGAREDIQPSTGPDIGFGDHGRRANVMPNGRWFYDAPSPTLAFGDLIDRSSTDLSEDLTLLIEALRLEGIDRAVIVELAPPDAGFSVVRAIVPRLESYIVDGRMGPTIRSLLGRHAPACEMPNHSALPESEITLC